MPIGRASIYRLSSRFVICAESTTRSGIGIAVEPYIVLSMPVSAVELGKAINHALASSHEGIAHPLSWKELAAPRLAAAGVKSEAAFQKQSALVSVVCDGKTVTFIPHRNGGATGNGKGFLPIDECEVRVERSTQEICGTTALQAFDRCT
jgi:hypothetical protein